MFDWNKLPKEEYANAIQMYNSDDVDGLYHLHQKYNLSTYEYCCGTDTAMRNHFYDAIYVKQIIT